jgi:hypothetical protein
MDDQDDEGQGRQQYEAPAVIYEGKIKTRAGTPPTGCALGAFDPSLLFNDEPPCDG